MFVESARKCPIVSKEAIKFADILENYIRKRPNAESEVFDRFKKTGFWRNLVIRQSFKNKEIIINLIIHRKNTPENAYSEIKKDLEELFSFNFFTLIFFIFFNFLLIHFYFFILLL